MVFLWGRLDCVGVSGRGRGWRQLLIVILRQYFLLLHKSITVVSHKNHLALALLFIQRSQQYVFMMNRCTFCRNKSALGGKFFPLKVHLKYCNVHSTAKEMQKIVTLKLI